MTIFVASVSYSENLTSFINRFFHFSGPLGFRLTFDAADENERFGHVQCQRSKENSSSGKRKRRVFFCRRTVRVKVKRKITLASFLKIKERGNVRWGERLEKEGRLVELVVIIIQVLKHLLGAREGEKRGSKGGVMRRATVRGAMKKNRYVTIIEEKEVRVDDAIEYFLNTGFRSTF